MNLRSFVPRFFCILAISISSLTFVVPQAHAQLVVKDPFNLAPNILQMVNTVQNTTKELGLDGIAKMIAQQMVKQVTRSIVTWINSGFDGNPSFVSDPEGFIQNTADQVTGEFLSKTGLNFLCEPFRLNVRLALVVGVAGGRSDFRNQYKCTLSGIIKNAEGFAGFMQGQFSANGGWNSWFQITQNNANNPIGAYIGAKGALEAKIGDKKLIESQKLDWGRGFMSWETCDETYKQALDRESSGPNPGTNLLSEIDATEKALAQAKANSAKATITNRDGASQEVRKLEAKLASLRSENDILIEAYERQQGTSGIYGPNQDGGNIATDDCAKKSIKTPGSVIEAQLNGVLPKELEGIVAADEINEIIGALASQLLTQAVTGFQGLAGTSKPRNGGKSVLEEYENEKSPNIANLRRQITNQIKRARAQLGSARYLRLKKLSLSYLVDMEEAQKGVVACYTAKKSSNPEDPVIDRRLNDATLVLAKDIVLLKKDIEADIQGASGRTKQLSDLENDLANASTVGELERIQYAVQALTEDAADAEGQKTSLDSEREDAVAQSKIDIEECENYQGNGGEIDPSVTSPVNGYLDEVTADFNVKGWACDPDQPGTAVKVSFYGTPNKENFLGETNSTSLEGDSVIAQYCGGNGAHRFIYSIPSYARTSEGEVHAFVLDPATNVEYRIGNSVNMPKTVIQNEKPIIVYSGFVPASQKVGVKTELWLLALDKERGPMTYSVTWGDEATNPASGGVFVGEIENNVMAKTFHSYVEAGTYTVKVNVLDDAENKTTIELPISVSR